MADFALGAFIAAGIAAFYSAGTYSLETRQALSETTCRRPEHQSPYRADVNLYVYSDNGNPTVNEPRAFNESNYQRNDYAFSNLGRTPLIDVFVTGTIVVGNAAPFVTTIPLRSIAVGGEIHVAVYVRNGLGTAEIRWQSATQGEQTLEFHPGPAIKVSPPPAIRGEA